MPELPDDLSQWPGDPFELLGVERGVDELTLRRAYMALIRKYKPEHAPDQFRKIREAFEACQNQRSWQSFFPEPFNPPRSTSPRPSEPNLDREPKSEPVEPESPILSELTPEQRLWNQAIEGDLAAAYSGLLRRFEERANGETARLLYWLLALAPDLDENQTRHEWLAQTFALGPVTHELIELLRRELETDPKQVDRVAYQNLLSIESLSHGQMIQLATMRILASGKSERFELIRIDLEACRERMKLDHQVDYLSLVTYAAEFVSFKVQKSIANWLDDELKQLSHLELQNSYFFDRIEQAGYLSVISSMSFGYEDLNSLLEWVQMCWRGRETLSEELFRKACSRLVQVNSEISLDLLHRYFVFRGRIIGQFIINILERSAPYRESEDLSEDDIRGLVTSYTHNGERKWLERTNLLNMCTDYSITWRELLDSCSRHPTPRIRSYADHLREDFAFQIMNHILLRLAV